MIYHQHITVSDYRRIGMTNEYWLWYFAASKPNPKLTIQPIETPWFTEDFHPFRDIVDQLEIPVFESKTKDSIDFLISMDGEFTPDKLIRKNEFEPLILGFNYMRLVSSTQHPNMCYCPEGVIELVAKMNVNLLERLKFD